MHQLHHFALYPRHSHSGPPPPRALTHSRARARARGRARKDRTFAYPRCTYGTNRSIAVSADRASAQVITASRCNRAQLTGSSSEGFIQTSSLIRTRARHLWPASSPFPPFRLDWCASVVYLVGYLDRRLLDRGSNSRLTGQRRLGISSKQRRG